MELNDALINIEMTTNSLALLSALLLHTARNDIRGAQSTVHTVLHLLLSLKRRRSGIYMRLLL
jgi:hypothetical protein